MLLLPLLTRALSAPEFGRLDLLSTCQSAAASVVLLGLDLAVTRLYADLGRAERPRMFTSWLCVTGLVVLPLALGMILAAKPLSRAVFGVTGYSTAIGLTALAIVGSVAQVVSLTVLRNRDRPIAYAIISGGTVIANGLFILAVVPADPTATAVMGAMAVSMCLGGIAGAVLVRSDLVASPSLELTKRLATLGLPAAPAVAATWLAELLNRGILLGLAGAAEAAFFSVATRFSSVAVLVTVGFQMAWQPTAFRLGSDPDALRKIADDGTRIVLLVALAAVGVALVSPELLTVVSGPDYQQALRPIGFSLVFAIAFAIYQASIMPSAISQEFRDIGISAVAAAVSSVALNSALAGAWGSEGTAIAVAAGQFLGAGLGIALARRRVAVPYPWGRIAMLTAVASTASVAATFPDGGADWRLRAVAGVIGMVWLLASFLRGKQVWVRH